MIIKEIEETLSGRGRGSGYAVHFVRLEDGGKGVWKPNIEIEKTSDLFIPTPANIHLLVPLKEALMYQIDQIIGAGLVPETEIHSHDGKWGVLQRFVERAIDGATALRDDNPRFRFESMQKLGVLDFICSNPDRVPSNWLVNPDGSLVAIDNAGAFQDRDSFTWSTATILGRPLVDEAAGLVKNAYERISDICRAILDIEYKPGDVVYKGANVLATAAELAVNHVHVLAAATGLTFDRYNVLGLVGCSDIGVDYAQD